MATVTRLGLLRHLRAEANEYVIYHKSGRLRKTGTGLAFWFNPITAAISKLPSDDCTTDLLVVEHTRDFQEVTVQATLRYRVAAPDVAATRFNFGIDLLTGRWLESPTEDLATLWQQKARTPVRQVIKNLSLIETMQSATSVLAEELHASLANDRELTDMGIELVSTQVVDLSPTAELEKALGVPTREALQQKADEALFERRALAVEKERAIKENELKNEIELELRREELIERSGANELLQVQTNSRSKQEEVERRVEREGLIAEAQAERTRITATAQADAERVLQEAKSEAEQKHFEIWHDAPPRLLLGLAVKELAGSINKVENLNLSPDLLGDLLTKYLSEGVKA